MRTVALISGGKDSCFNMLQCIAAGNEIVALANLHPPSREQNIDSNSEHPSADEMDSYMYQTVGHDAIDLLAKAMELPLYRKVILGKSINTDSDYFLGSQDDEVEDLYRLLTQVKECEKIEAVSVGAILSNYQRVRVEHVCNRLGLTSLSYLWQRDQKELLEEMINCGMDAILIKVAALGLNPLKHLGKSIKNCQDELIQLERKFGLNVCGEGGEYETLTLDCPIFKKRIAINETEMVFHSKDPFAPVAYLRFPNISLVNKELDAGSSHKLVKTPEEYCHQELDNSEEIAPLNVLSDPQNDSDVDLTNLGENFTPTLPDSSRNPTDLFFIGELTAQSESDFVDMMNNFRGIVLSNGSSMDYVLSVCLYIRDMADFPKVNQMYKQFFHLNPPVRVCVQAPLTCYATIEAIATKSTIGQIQTMHVQSVSHWAPANIGPYSQCVKIQNLLMVSGQIGLIPGSMVLPSPPNFKGECHLALRHANRVLCAMDRKISLLNSIQVICFVRDSAHIKQAHKIWDDCLGSNALVNPIAFIVTTGLPRNALVEWQIWAYGASKLTDQFTVTVSPTKEIGVVHVTKCADVDVFIGKLSELPTGVTEWRTFFEIIDHRLKRVASHQQKRVSMKMYYKTSLPDFELKNLRDAIPASVVSTLVPVCGFESGVEFLICGLACYIE